MRLASARRHPPVDAAGIVARLIQPGFIELHAATLDAGKIGSALPCLVGRAVLFQAGGRPCEIDQRLQVGPDTTLLLPGLFRMFPGIEQGHQGTAILAINSPMTWSLVMPSASAS